MVLVHTSPTPRSFVSIHRVSGALPELLEPLSKPMDLGSEAQLALRGEKEQDDVRNASVVGWNR